jgi:SPP1 gp7 family putative phage head morphogenesis protein
MCDTQHIAEQLRLVREARITAEGILETYFHLPIHKAYNLGNPTGFNRAVVDLSTKLKESASGPEDDAVRAAIKVLDVDWYETTAKERRELIAQSMRAAELETVKVAPMTEVVFGDAADDVVTATRSSVRTDQKLKIGTSFNALDKRIVRHLETSNSYFIRDEYGRRNEAFGRQAAGIVSDGLESGLGRDAIARDLERAAMNTIAGQGSNYWDVVAASFIGRGRSYSQLSAYREANITRYRFEAVLDEVTTETCRFFHGKVFSVDNGIRLFEQVEQNPEALKEINPWVRSGVDKDGNTVLFAKKNGRKIPIATVEQSGFGTKDDVGTFRNSRSEQELMDLGISHPPLHGLCRSSTHAA